MEIEIQTLSGLKSGDSATIDRFLSNDPALRRFREMGLLPGTEVAVIRRAPLGDPIEISVRGSLLSVRKEEAQLIAIRSNDKAENESGA